MTQEDINTLENQIENLKEQLSKLLATKKSSKSYCCTDICYTFKSELDSIEKQIFEIDKSAYKKFPLFVQYFAKTKMKKGITLKDYSRAVFNNEKDRQEFITHFYEQKQVKEILSKKNILNDLLKQIKSNNICKCEL